MIYLLPLILSFLIYIITEEKNLIRYGMISLLINMMLIKEINNEILMIIYINLLILYWLYLSKDNTLNMIGGLFMIGGYLSIISTSILSLFISIEILSFTIIILINLYIQDQYPGIIYYLISGIFTSILILGLGYLYIGYTIAYKFLLIVFMFKLGLIPFHILLPNIYMNISTSNILLIDIIYKLIIFYIFIKLNLSFSSFYIIFLLLFSSIASLRYKNLINIMIYSSILNYSLLLIIINLKNYSLFIYYIIFYSIFILIYLYLITNIFINKQFSHSYYLYFWLILLFNLIGIPPLSGFLIKFNILLYIIINKLYLIFFIAIISLLLISYTYLRIINTMIMSNENYKIINNNPMFTNLISSLIIFISFPLLTLLKYEYKK